MESDSDKNRYYTHKFRAEIEFSVPHCLSHDSSVSLTEERQWVEARMAIALSEHLQKNLGLEMILSHLKTEEEVQDVVQ